MYLTKTNHYKTRCKRLFLRLFKHHLHFFICMMKWFDNTWLVWRTGLSAKWPSSTDPGTTTQWLKSTTRPIVANHQWSLQCALIIDRWEMHMDIWLHEQMPLHLHWMFLQRVNVSSYCYIKQNQHFVAKASRKSYSSLTFRFIFKLILHLWATD